MRKKTTSDSSKRDKLWFSVSPWLILASIAILLPIFIYLTFDNINKQRQYTEKLLVEKGAALIRSFEAGARTGIGMQWSWFQLQKLLIETAQQPGIDYLIVTDARGLILADSDPSMVGETYGDGLDLEALSRMKNIQWREVANQEGADTFEVFRRFAPSDATFDVFPRELIPQGEIERESGQAGYVIFVGLDMDPIDKARAADLSHAVVMGIILLLLGFAGFVMLLLAQNYHSTKRSLASIKAFSDSLVEHMPIGLIALNGEKNIVAVNQAAEKIFRLPDSNLTGRSAAGVLPPECTAIVDGLRKGAVIEKEIPCRAGESTLLLDVLATSLDDGHPSSSSTFVILFRDMTEVKHLRDEVARTRRLASIGSIAAGIAHEIRNPLSSIKGFATYFKERYAEIPEDRGTAEIMVQEVDRLNRVINQLLSVARPMTIEKKPQPLQPIIRHGLRMIENKAREKEIRVTEDLPDTVADVPADKDAIGQALLNLFLNAVESMDKGGTLSVALRESGGGLVRIEVADTGCGIEKRELDRIFDLYYTTKPSGTGLGLPMVQKIIDAHGGDIRIESEPGSGTLVEILLPTN